MRATTRLILLAPGLLTLFGCLGLCGGANEGANPGECSDGADSDEDGDFDCDDEDCAGAPDCQEESDTDTDADADSDTDSDADTDSGWYPEDFAIDVVQYGYDSREWNYSVDLDGWGDRVTLTISQDNSSPWEEFHELANIDYDPGGAWDLWEIDLDIVSSYSQQEGNVSTLYTGDVERSMVWRIEAYSHGDEDCVVWAGDSADAGVLMEAGCREILF